jgi:hypothetical protein
VNFPSLVNQKYKFKRQNNKMELAEDPKDITNTYNRFKEAIASGCIERV